MNRDHESLKAHMSELFDVQSRSRFILSADLSFPFSLSLIRRMESSIFLRSSPAFLALSIAICRSIFKSDCIRSSSSTDGTASGVFLNKAEMFNSGIWYELSLAGMVCNGPRSRRAQWMGVCSSTRDRYIGGRASVVVVAVDESGGWRKRKSIFSDYSGFPRLLILATLIQDLISHMGLLPTGNPLDQSSLIITSDSVGNCLVALSQNLRNNVGSCSSKAGCASCPCCIHPYLHIDLFVNIPILPLPTPSNDLMVRFLTMVLCLGTWVTLCFLIYSGLAVSPWSWSSIEGGNVLPLNFYLLRMSDFVRIVVLVSSLQTGQSFEGVHAAGRTINPNLSWRENHLSCVRLRA